MADSESDSSTEAIEVDDYGKSLSSVKKKFPKIQAPVARRPSL
jgi:hypothetical protein